jgi:hypothetical protein
LLQYGVFRAPDYHRNFLPSPRSSRSYNIDSNRNPLQVPLVLEVTLLSHPKLRERVHIHESTFYGSVSFFTHLRPSKGSWILACEETFLPSRTNHSLMSKLTVLFCLGWFHPSDPCSFLHSTNHDCSTLLTRPNNSWGQTRNRVRLRRCGIWAILWFIGSTEFSVLGNFVIFEPVTRYN